MGERIANPSRTREILNRYDLHALKRFGQNFLIDPNIAEKIADAAADSDCVCMEVGPGIGSLTEILAEKAKALYAYEIDKKLVPVLKEELKEHDNLYVINEDFMKTDLTALPFKDEEITFCSNLPYYITTPIIFKTIESDLKIRRMTLMMQKEVADRLKAPLGSADYAALTLMIQDCFEVKELCRLSRNAYDPKPQVDSSVLVLTPRQGRDRAFEKRFYPFVQDCFTQRRKTLHNNLKGKADSQKIEEAYRKLSLKESVRPQELTLGQYKDLFEALYD